MISRRPWDKTWADSVNRWQHPDMREGKSLRRSSRGHRSAQLWTRLDVSPAWVRLRRSHVKFRFSVTVFAQWLPFQPRYRQVLQLSISAHQATIVTSGTDWRHWMRSTHKRELLVQHGRCDLIHGRGRRGQIAALHRSDMRLPANQSKSDDTPHVSTFPHILVTLINFIKSIRSCDQLVELQLSAFIETQQPRDVVAWIGVPK